MRLKIYSLKGVEFDGKAEGLNVKTASGEITVLNRHIPIVTVLRPCTAKIRIRGEETVLKEIRSGFLEMDEYNNLSVLVN